MSTRSPLARRVIAALLLVLLTACHSWQPTAISPQALIPAERPSSVRATLPSGGTVTVRDPFMRNDSIVGYTDAGAAAAALGDVRLLEERRLSIGQSLAVVFASAVFILLAVGVRTGVGIE